MLGKYLWQRDGSSSFAGFSDAATAVSAGTAAVLSGASFVATAAAGRAAGATSCRVPGTFSPRRQSLRPAASSGSHASLATADDGTGGRSWRRLGILAPGLQSPSAISSGSQ